MPSLRKHDTCIINEWTLSEIANAYSTQVHAINANNANVSISKRDGRLKKGWNDWYGGINSLSDVTRLVTEGWHEGVNRLEQLARDMPVPTVRTRRRRVTWRDQGDELDTDRAMRGDFDTAWRSSRRVWTAGPATVDLYTIYGGAASRTAEQIFWNGAACVVAADKLEAAGYPVRIVACFFHGGSMGDEDGRSDRIQRSDVVIKEANEPLRIDAVASVLCHAGVYRTLLFKTWLSGAVQLNDGLGPAIYSWTKEVTDKLKAAGEWPDGAVIVDRANSREECIAQITKIVEQTIGG